MENFLFKKIELWIAALLLLGCFVGAIFFGWVVQHVAKGGLNAGVIGEIALEVANIPSNLRELLKRSDARLISFGKEFPTIPGFNFAGVGELEGPDGYLALSRHDGDRQRSVLEIVDLKKRKTIHTYEPNFDEINSRSSFTSELMTHPSNMSANQYQMIHPLVTDDGGIIFHNKSPLVSVDYCSKIKWVIDGVFHHSIEKDSDRNIWVPSYIEPISIKGVSSRFLDDAISKISPNGKVIFKRSVAQIFIENGLQHLIYVVPDILRKASLTHLNDIQPVLKDGKYWKKGDLFLSLRNVSMIVLYRPSTGKIIWHKQGPWILQHDVNMLNDHQISVFSNNVITVNNASGINKANEVYVYDFEKNTVSSPYKEAMAKLDIRTITSGRGRVLENGDLYVEETNFGRLIRTSKEGDIRWNYFNSAKNGNNYIVSWSRFLYENPFSKMSENNRSERCDNK